MTLLEFVFALFMFAGSSAASMFAISTTIVQLRTLDEMQSVHDAANEVCALRYGGEMIPSIITADGKVCKVNMDVPVGQEAVHFEIQSGKSSQSIWMSSDS